METPTVALQVWVLGAFDPVLIAIAAFLGWKADQFAKVFIAAIAALLISVPVSWGINALGLPWIAPVGGEQPMLLQGRRAADAAASAHRWRHPLGELRLSRAQAA